MRNPFRRKAAQEHQEPARDRQPARYQAGRPRGFPGRVTADQQPVCLGGVFTQQAEREAR